MESNAKCPLEGYSVDNAADTWMELAAWFELLAHGLLKPTMITAQALCNGDYLQECQRIATTIGASLDTSKQIEQNLLPYESQNDSEVFHSILREYTRLFVGTREALITPFVGIHIANMHGQHGMLFVGHESIEIERIMKRCGVAKNLSLGQSNDPVDHVGTLCEFLKYLCLVNAKAIVPVKGAKIGDQEFHLFMSEHFIPYAEWCAEELDKLSTVSFYKAIAIMLKIVATQA